MAATTKNLKDPLPAQNPRRSHKSSYPTQSAYTHTEAFLQSQSSSSQALSRPHRSCKQAFSRSRSPCIEKRFPSHESSSISLSRSRLIALPHSPCQQTVDPTMPLSASQETRSWLQQRGLGGYLRVIDSAQNPPWHSDQKYDLRRSGPETWRKTRGRNPTLHDPRGILRYVFDFGESVVYLQRTEQVFSKNHPHFDGIRVCAYQSHEYATE